MLKRQKIKIFIFLISITIIGVYFFISSLIENPKFSNLKSLLNVEQKELIKKYIFPYKVISKQQQIISQQQQTISQQKFTANLLLSNLELLDKEKGHLIPTFKKTEKLFDDKTIDKYKLSIGFYAGINNEFPGSGYIDFYKSNIIVLSSRGVLAFKKNIEDINENFQQIKNNINEFIGKDQFKKHKWFSIKDLLIYKDKIFVSYTEQIKKNCWNTSIIYGNINKEYIQFNKL